MAVAETPTRGGQGGQERHSPDAASPRNIGQQHHGEPAQPAGFDEVAVRGAYRVAVGSTRLDLAAPSWVSSRPMMTGPLGTKALTSSRNKRPATRRLDHYF